jgi:hypothetical protein
MDRTMRCAIMQPTYLPWSGYFNLIANVDVFIFLDDVQYEKGEWQNRNRILYNSKIHWLTVPVRHNSLSQKIYTVLIDSTKNWRKKHRLTLEYAYKNHPFGLDVLDVILPIINDERITQLATFNRTLTLSIADALGIASSKLFTNSSELKLEGARTERLVKMCEYFGCNEYISPVGAKCYLEKDGDFQKSAVRLTFQDFTPGYYPQKNQDTFVSHLSIVDVVANIGWSKSRDYIIYGK